MPHINEGPVALVKGKTVHIIYSASGSWSDYYCLGKLTFSGEGDILDKNNWKKSDAPVFSKTDKTFGPGHCSFTTDAEDRTIPREHCLRLGMERTRCLDSAGRVGRRGYSLPENRRRRR